MDKIDMRTPLVEMDGDEMTRIIWALIKERLIEPFVDLKTEYYDLGLKHRDETDDAVTREAALAIRRLGVGVKCATITPNAARVEEYGLKKMYKSPNGTIRAMLDGTVFRAPIPVEGISPLIAGWKKPIIIARHAYGDIYRDAEMEIEGPGTLELVFTPQEGDVRRMPVHTFDAPGVALAMHNLDASIAHFARACFAFALDSNCDLWFSAKDTISKRYDGRFRDIFERVYAEDFHARFEERGLTYFYTLIDDAVARLVRGGGGMVWACKNYDGDVMSDMVATIFGSLAMMTSVLVSPDGYYEFEAAHGTVQRHYYRYLKGEETSTNPTATIFSWTGALRKRGQMDGTERLAAFADSLETALRETIAAGDMTGDLFALSLLEDKRKLSTEAFVDCVAARLKDALEARA